MKAGEIRLKWNSIGELDIKCSLSVNSSENKKLAIDVLLDAAKAINGASSALELPPGLTAPARILGGNG